jgi:hypothetical protein
VSEGEERKWRWDRKGSKGEERKRRWDREGSEGEERKRRWDRERSEGDERKRRWDWDWEGSEGEERKGRWVCRGGKQRSVRKESGTWSSFVLVSSQSGSSERINFWSFW